MSTMTPRIWMQYLNVLVTLPISALRGIGISLNSLNKEFAGALLVEGKLEADS